MDGEKNRFVHDLRNPLNTISVNAELGKLTLERTGDIRKAISIFETILLECRQCSQLLETLKDTRFVRDESHSESQE
ncbi:sensor protein/histidine kinase [Cellvibrio sp. BR]|jgi:signal transduction histidine kinase|uniref:histidine kinase dimerization/phospho-acceptor domain-containing protein n=1 Tax=Cellvibrio sp. BR TaxID=1134474 RepID=UPI00026013BA|nr:histidine kinase dimerization/phospho-acceptor domain-containing protein [Cellvibrio sp. BR]EIK45296.1 sensor protein/histidine kinase [Cellvibrio sp. BR]